MAKKGRGRKYFDGKRALKKFKKGHGGFMTEREHHIFRAAFGMAWKKCKKRQQELTNKEAKEEICPSCRFPKRISGHVFITDAIEYKWSEKQRCELCKHLPDYKILKINPNVAEIIYRNFNGSREYFEGVTNNLKEKGFEVVNELENKK